MQTKPLIFINRCIFTLMEDSVLCYSSQQNRHITVNKKIVTASWMQRTGFAPVEIPSETPLFCEEVKSEMIEAPKNKGGRPKREEKLN